MYENFKEILKSHGLKVTNQRVLLLEALSKHKGEHLTPEEIYEIVKEEHPEIGLATVYRTIQLLCQLELVEKVVLVDGIVRYEMAERGRGRAHHHHHIICLGCGNVESFEDDLLENLESAIAKKTGFEIVNHEVKFYGYCNKCKEKHKN
jgi:Fur family ferric uptake transcriptional regulator